MGCLTIFTSEETLQANRPTHSLIVSYHIHSLWPFWAKQKFFFCQQELFLIED